VDGEAVSLVDEGLLDDTAFVPGKEAVESPARLVEVGLEDEVAGLERLDVAARRTTAVAGGEAMEPEDVKAGRQAEGVFIGPGVRQAEGCMGSVEGDGSLGKGIDDVRMSLRRPGSANQRPGKSKVPKSK